MAVREEWSGKVATVRGIQLGPRLGRMPAIRLYNGGASGPPPSWWEHGYDPSRWGRIRAYGKRRVLLIGTFGLGGWLIVSNAVIMYIIMRPDFEQVMGVGLATAIHEAPVVFIVGAIVYIVLGLLSGLGATYAMWRYCEWMYHRAKARGL